MAYIYKLIFDNGDFYIGQTSNIEVRITNHRSSKGKGSPKLQKAFKTSKYLGYEILEECDEELLNTKEAAYIKELNPPLNTLPGGDSLRGLNHPRAKYSKKQIEEVVTLYLETDIQASQIADLTEVAYGTVMDIVKMRSHSWATAGKEAQLKQARDRRNPTATTVYDKYNNVYEVKQRLEFEKEHNLSDGTISRLEHSDNLDGWSLEKHPVLRLKNHEDEIVLTKPLAREFLQELGLSKYQISQLIQKNKASAGWKVSTVS